MNTQPLFDLGRNGGPYRHRLSAKQKVIIMHLKANPTMTLADAVSIIGGNLYCNAEKHVGATLSNMVRQGMIERVKPGVFRLPTSTKQ